MSSGGGTYFIMASSTLSIFVPSFALTGIAMLASMPKTSSISAFTRSTSAEGKSILFITGIISKFCSNAR